MEKSTKQHWMLEVKAAKTLGDLIFNVEFYADYNINKILGSSQFCAATTRYLWLANLQQIASPFS